MWLVVKVDHNLNLDVNLFNNVPDIFVVERVMLNKNLLSGLCFSPLDNNGANSICISLKVNDIFSLFLIMVEVNMIAQLHVKEIMHVHESDKLLVNNYTIK